MFTDNFGKAKDTQQVSQVIVQCFKSLNSVPRSTPDLEQDYCDSDEEEDLIVDLTTGSLKPMNLKNYLVMNEVMNGLESL